MKYSCLTVFACLLLLARPVFASPGYGTMIPEKNRIFMGLAHYLVQGKSLGSNLGSVHSHQNYLTLSYGITDWFSLDLKASLHGTFSHTSGAGDRLEYKIPVWGGGYGFRLQACESGAWRVVTGFQHFSIHPKAIEVNGEKSKGILEDWQGSALISYGLKRVTPYAGVRYTVMDYIHRRNDQRKMIKFDEDRRAGIITGLDIPLNDNVWINLESDWQDGGSAAAGVYYRF